MNIKYEMYRSKDKKELFNYGTITVNIETENQLLGIDEIILKILAEHQKSVPEIIKYGTAYLGRLVIDEIEITKEDVGIDLDEVQFNAYMSKVIPGLKIVWNK